ncbi:MAG: DUF3971 domain-containing protein [Magnetospirillum sp. WYHS-4]
MIKRTFRGLIQILGGLGAGLAIVTALAAWRLSSGPISLTFLTPHLERILSEAHPDIRVRLDDTILTWGGWQRALDIRVVNARAIDPLETVLARVPELSLSLSVAALARGVAAPRRLELIHPSLTLVRMKDGRLQVSLGGDAAVGEGEEAPEQGTALTRMLEQLTEPPRPELPLSYLARIDVIEADLTLIDHMLGVSWRAPAARLHLRRDDAGLRGELSFDLAVEGHKAHLALLGDYRTQDRRLDLGLEFDGLRPALFSRLAPALAPVAALELPVHGTASLSLDKTGQIEAVGFDIKGSDGHLALPDPFAQRIAVKAVTLKGRAGGPDENLIVEHLGIDFVDGARLLLPAPTNHEMPIRTLRAAGVYSGQARTADISLLEIDLSGPRLSVAGRAEGIASAPGTTVTAHALLAGTRTDDLKRYWPKAWGSDAHAWVTTHMSEGGVPRAEADIALRFLPDGKVALESLTGDMDIENVTVDYLPPMPKARKAYGRATFNPQRFDIVLSRGEVRDLAVRKGTVFLTGLDQRDQFADIELFIDGPVRGALELVDHKPLGFASALGVLPAGARGTAHTRLKLDFILEKTVTMDQVDVAAEAALKGLRLANAVLGREVGDGELDLKVDKQGMDVRGNIRLAGVPATLLWRRNFGDKAAVVSHYDLRGRIPDVRNTEDLGLGLGPFAGNYVRGAADIALQFTQFKGGRNRLKASADLKDLSVDIPAINWYKSMGVEGKADLGLVLQGETVTDIEEFSIVASNLVVTGDAVYSKAGTGLDRLRFTRLAYGNGRTDMKGTLTPQPDGGWKVALSGAAFDLAPALEDKPHGATAKPDQQPWDSLALTVDVDLDTIWVSKDHKLRRIKGSLNRARELWRSVGLEGRDEGGQAFRIRVVPETAGKRALTVHADDAGSFLKTLGFYENMIGGTLDIQGRYDDTDAASPLAGTLEIKDYRVRNAHLLAHLVSLAAITGILDGLQGEGIGFLKLEAPFVYRDGIAEVNEAKSSGVSLGFTASGRIDTVHDTLDMQGTIVPAYALNTFLGNVPILGEILTGGEKGGGVFAARYRISGPSDKPEATVNPLSALTPGFLRNLFDIFDDPKAKTPEKKAPQGKEAPSGGL